MLFDRLINGAFWLSIALIGFSLWLMLIVFWLHDRTTRRRRRVDSLMTRWDTAFGATLRGEACDVPVADKGTAVERLRAWCDVSDVARSASALRLVPKAWLDVARRVGLAALARRFVERGDPAEQVVGARTLGILADPCALLRLKVLCSKKGGDVSFAAATALVRINRSFAGVFVACLRDRSDWSAPQVEEIVRENALLFGPEFDLAIRGADDAGMRRLLEFVPLLDRERVRSMAIYALEPPRRDAENVSAALRALRLFVERADVPRLQWLAEDPVVGVRVQAINALGEVDDPHAEATLIAHLDDPDAWVRRRAKEALARSAQREDLSCCL